MIPRILIVLAMIFAGIWSPAAMAQKGRFEQFPNFPSRYVAPRNVTVWLPPDYDPNGPPYAVIYMQDGQNLFDRGTAYNGQAWDVDAVLSRTVAEHRTRPAIIVAIWNTRDRLRDYMPAKIFARLPPDLRDRVATLYQGTPQSDAYLAFMVRELKPFIDKRFHTSRKRSDTIVMGSSMGGLISLYALAEYPAVFGRAACLSSHWALVLPKPDEAMSPAEIDAISRAFTGYVRETLPAPGTHRIWFDHGDQTLDRLYAPFQQGVDRAFEQRGWIQGRDWVTRVFPGAAHNEQAWRDRLDLPLEFILGKQPQVRRRQTPDHGSAQTGEDAKMPALQRP